MKTINDQPGTSAIAIGLLTAAITFGGGCSMCCGPYDYHYPTFGGRVQRSDPVWGRVGSLFSDPGPFGGPPADYNLKPHEGAVQSTENLESVNGNDTDLTPPENMIEDSLPQPENSDILPPPTTTDRPGPDDGTMNLRRLRNQSRAPGRGRWR